MRFDWDTHPYDSHQALERILREQGVTWGSASPIQKFSAVIAANLRGGMDRLDPRLIEFAMNESSGWRMEPVNPRLVTTEFYDLIMAMVMISIAAGNPRARELAEWTMRSCGTSIFMGALSSEARYAQQEKEIRHDEMLRTMADLSLSINDVDPDLLRLLTGEAEGGS
jgi:hypothetical protein